MTQKTRTNIIKMLILALGVTAVLGKAGTAMAAGRDLVGKGTKITAQAVAESDSSEQSAGESTGEDQTNQTGQTGQTGQTDQTNQTGQTGQNDSSKRNPITEEAGTKTPAAVQTGVMDQLYPFVTMLAVHFVLFALFVHLRLNQSRYGRSQVHWREIDDFHWMMRHLDD